MVELEKRVPKVLLYSQTWDDFEIVKMAFKFREGGSNVVSIASAGDNILHLLLQDTGKIYAVDYNPRQIALLKLKMKAFQHLDNRELKQLVGVLGDRQVAVYHKLRPHLDPATREYWDAHEDYIANRLYRCGDSEKRIRILRIITSLFIPPGNMHRFLALNDLAEQERQFRRFARSILWNILGRCLINKFFIRLMKLHHGSFYNAKFVHYKDFMITMKNAFCSTPLRENFFIAQLLTGRFLYALPEYLHENNFMVIKNNLSKIIPVNSPLGSALKNIEKNTIDCFNYTDAIEWLNKKQQDTLFTETIRCARPGARIFTMDCLIDTEIPPQFQKYIILDNETSGACFKVNRTPMYRNVKIYKIVK